MLKLKSHGSAAKAHGTADNRDIFGDADQPSVTLHYLEKFLRRIFVRNLFVFMMNSEFQLSRLITDVTDTVSVPTDGRHVISPSTETCCSWPSVL